MTSKGSSENGSVTSLEKDGPAGPGIIIIQICVVLLFMAGLVGAFYYAIYSAEVDPEKIHHEWKLSQNYSALFSQFSSKLGKFTLTVKPSDKMEEMAFTYPVYWYQDHNKKEIVHKINNDTIAYALADFTFWVKLDQKQQPKECLEDEKGGYLDYIQKLGLFEMEDRHTAIARIRDSKAVYVYDVHPKPDKFLHEHGYIKGDALLVQAYVDKETGTFLGWQTYFTAADNASHHLRRTEYWFPDMEQETPPEDAFKQIPSICYPAR